MGLVLRVEEACGWDERMFGVGDGYDEMMRLRCYYWILRDVRIWRYWLICIRVILTFIQKSCKLY